MQKTNPPQQAKQYWLLKTEPGTFSIDDLCAAQDQITSWEGVRNYQARNFLKTSMQKGDLAFFYHSSCKQPSIMGIVQIVRAGYPDHSAFDPLSEYFDPKSHPTHPRWYTVDVKLVKKLPKAISLSTLKQCKLLASWQLLAQGNRLSILPVSEKQWNTVLSLT